eukprot:jgi/Bigna1/88663/estExt_fgenesh1_pg.C_360023
MTLIINYSVSDYLHRNNNPTTAFERLFIKEQEDFGFLLCMRKQDQEGNTCPDENFAFRTKSIFNVTREDFDHTLPVDIDTWPLSIGTVPDAYVALMKKCWQIEPFHCNSSTINCALNRNFDVVNKIPEYVTFRFSWGTREFMRDSTCTRLYIVGYHTSNKWEIFHSFQHTDDFIPVHCIHAVRRHENRRRYNQVLEVQAHFSKFVRLNGEEDNRVEVHTYQGNPVAINDTWVGERQYLADTPVATLDLYMLSPVGMLWFIDVSKEQSTFDYKTALAAVLSVAGFLNIVAKCFWKKDRSGFWLFRYGHRNRTLEKSYRRRHFRVLNDDELLDEDNSGKLHFNRGDSISMTTSIAGSAIQ